MYNEILDVELGPNVLHNFFLSLKPPPISPAYSPWVAKNKTMKLFH